MGLSSEIFSEITDAVTLSGPDEASEGDRRSSRVEMRTHVTLLPWNNPSQEISVRIRDLSPEGLGVLHSQRLSLDDSFVVCFPVGGKTVTALYTIAYWEPLAENLYAIGGQFDRMVDAAQLAERRAMFAETPKESTSVFARIGSALGRRRKAS